jgi:ABC-type polysaccharide/polyol phosphate export permease
MKRFFEDVKKYYNYEVQSAKSALKTEVANSYLNWIWWILDPLLSMMVYYLIFGIVFKKNELYFTNFLFIGQTMWAFFSKNVTQSVKMIKRNKGIVSKVYIPKFVLLISNMMVNGFKMVISWIIVVIMMATSQVQLSYHAFACIPILFVMFLVTFAVSVNLMHFGVFVEDLGNVVNIAMQLLFYLTGIFYNIDSRLGGDHPLAAKLLSHCNPMAFLIKEMRNVLLYQQGPEWMSLGIWAVIGIALSVVGVRMVYKNENSYVKVI